MPHAHIHHVAKSTDMYFIIEIPKDCTDHHPILDWHASCQQISNTLT